MEILPPPKPEPPYNPNRRKTKEQKEREALLRKQAEEWERYKLAHAAEWKEESERAYAAALREAGAENLSPYERSLLEKYPEPVEIEDVRVGSEVDRRIHRPRVTDEELAELRRWRRERGDPDDEEDEEP